MNAKKLPPHLVEITPELATFLRSTSIDQMWKPYANTEQFVINLLCVRGVRLFSIYYHVSSEIIQYYIQDINA